MSATNQYDDALRLAELCRQELEEQRARARQLFHCYADEEYEADATDEETEDAYEAYYGERP